MQQIACIFTSYSARRHTSSSPVTIPKLDTFKYSAQSATKHRRSKFAPKSHEGFLLGYGSNSHTYHVYNSFTWKVEETVDVTFDESNGSQVEELPIDVGDKDRSEVIQDLSIGKIPPTEVKESTSSVQVEASTSRQGEPRVDLEASTSGTRQDDENEDVQQDEPRWPPSPPPWENNNTNNNEERQEEEQDNEEDVPPRPKQKLSRVRARISRDHPIEQIFDEIQTERTTRSKTRLANFCEHYSFISSIEPMKVEEALEDPDWINDTHEELHNFERNQVWTLVQKPVEKHNVIGTKWVFWNK